MDQRRSNAFFVASQETKHNRLQGDNVLFLRCLKVVYEKTSYKPQCIETKSSTMVSAPNNGGYDFSGGFE